jgi:LPS export ABC transporter protein LptC
MSGPKKVLTLVLGVLASVAVYAFYWLIIQSEVKIPLSTPASIVLEQPSLTKTGPDGKKRWTLTAQQIYSDKEKTEAKKIKLIFFEDDKESLSVEGERLILDPDTNDMILTGRLKATAKDFVLETENLTWDGQTETISTDALVTVEHPEMILTGIGFDYSPKTGVGMIKKDAHLVWKQKEPRP